MMVFHTLPAQKSIKSIYFDFEFEQDTISIVDPVIVKVTLKNIGRKTLKAYSPFDVMKASIKKEGTDLWINNRIMSQGFNISQMEYGKGYTETIEYHFPLRSLEEGAHLLRLEYIPNRSKRNTQKIVVEKKFIVEYYTSPSERKPIDWILENNSTYGGEYLIGITRGASLLIPGLLAKEHIELATNFISLYPESRYSSVFYYMKADNLWKHYRYNNMLDHAIYSEMLELLLQAREKAYYPKLKYYIGGRIKDVNVYLASYRELQKQ